MHNSLLQRHFTLAVVIASFLTLARNSPLAEHIGFVEIPPHDDVFYFLRIYSGSPLLIWLGHTPGHPINYRLSNSAIPPFDQPISMLMIDLPGVGKTKSNRAISVDSLASFLKVSIQHIKSVYGNYSDSFKNVWVGGEKYMTPLVLSLGEILKSDNAPNVAGIILGNPYLEPRLSIPRRFQIVKHFGYLDIEKEDQFNFLNDLCMKNPSLAGCSRSDKLFDIVTNKSEPLTTWSESYMTSVIEIKDYLSTFITVLNSQKYKVLLYTGQLDLNSGFQLVHSVLQHFAVGDAPAPLKYYRSERAVRGFFLQNSYWTLLQVYNSSANVTHSQPDTVGSAIEEFIKVDGALRCGESTSSEKCDMQAEISKAMPNCSTSDWTSRVYHCTCDNGKYGTNCMVDVPSRVESENYTEYLPENEVAYVRFVVTGKGQLVLTQSVKNCTVDIYANVFPGAATDGSQNFADIPNNARHDIHTRKGKIFIFGTGDDSSTTSETVVMVKLLSRCENVVQVSLAYHKDKSTNFTLYWILAGIVAAVMVGLGVAMIWVWRKVRSRKNSPAPLLASVASS